MTRYDCCGFKSIYKGQSHLSTTPKFILSDKYMHRYIYTYLCVYVCMCVCVWGGGQAAE